MAIVARAEQHRLEQAVFQLRFEGGLQAMRSWLLERQAEIHRQWYELSGDDLHRMQGEAQLIGRQLKILDIAPTIQ